MVEQFLRKVYSWPIFGKRHFFYVFPHNHFTTCGVQIVFFADAPSPPPPPPPPTKSNGLVYWDKFSGIHNQCMILSSVFTRFVYLFYLFMTFNLGERHISIFTTSNIIVTFGRGGVWSHDVSSKRKHRIYYKSCAKNMKPVNIAQVLILNLYITFKKNTLFIAEIVGQ